MSENNVEVCPYCDGECDTSTCPKFLAYKKVQDPEAVKAKLTEMGVDPNGDALTVMMGMQKIFAERFHQIDGLTKDEVDHWVKDYDVCITDEVTEVLEHLSVFPGVEPKEDLYELQKEFIDIWHFLMDEFLVASLAPEKLIKLSLGNQFQDIEVSELVNPLKIIFSLQTQVLKSEAYNLDLDNLTRQKRDQAILIQANMILMWMSMVRKQISWKHWKKPSPTIDYDKLHAALSGVFNALVRSFILTGLDAEKLTEIYITKNLENVFRQEFGY